MKDETVISSPQDDTSPAHIRSADAHSTPSDQQRRHEHHRFRKIPCADPSSAASTRSRRLRYRKAVSSTPTTSRAAILAQYRKPPSECVNRAQKRKPRRPRAALPAAHQYTQHRDTKREFSITSLSSSDAFVPRRHQYLRRRRIYRNARSLNSLLPRIPFSKDSKAGQSRNARMPFGQRPPR